MEGNCMSCCVQFETLRKKKYYRKYKLTESSQVQYLQIYRRQLNADRKKVVFFEHTLEIGDQICNTCFSSWNNNKDKPLPTTASSSSDMSCTSDESEIEISDDEADETEDSTAESESSSSSEDDNDERAEQVQPPLEQSENPTCSSYSVPNPYHIAPSVASDNPGSVCEFTLEFSEYDDNVLDTDEPIASLRQDELSNEPAQPEQENEDSNREVEQDTVMVDDSDYVPPAQPSQNSTSEQVAKSLSSHSICIFRCQQARSLTNVPLLYRQFCLAISNLYVPPGARCCKHHLEESLDNWRSVQRAPNSSLTIEQYQEGIQLLRDPMRARFFGTSFPEPSSATHDFYKTWTGLEPQQFLNLLATLQLPKDPRNRVSLALTLMKLRKNLTFEDLASLSGLSYTNVNNAFHRLIQILDEKFVPLNLGFAHLSREQAITHHTPIARDLFNVPQDKVIVVSDATYFYHQKSSNFPYQRRSFSGFKAANLVKPFITCLPDGYIIDIDSENCAADNDAIILKKILTSNNRAIQFFRQGDVFILDRGFRDVIPFLTSKGYVSHMPKTRQSGQRQLTTEEANYSRKVSKVRWVIEAINGMLKGQFKICREIWQNTIVDKSPEIVRVCGALLNAYYPRLISDRGCQTEIITKMLSLENKTNRLADMIASINANNLRVVFPNVNTLQQVHQWFPSLTLDDLYFYAQGSYQLKHVASYATDARRLNDSGITFQCHDETAELEFDQFDIDVDEPLLLRAKIPSRHSENKTYIVYILLDYRKTGVERIIEHYCNCIAGKRTVGCCSHIMTVIWYAVLGCTSDIRVPAQHLQNFAKRIRFATPENSETED